MMMFLAEARSRERRRGDGEMWWEISVLGCCLPDIVLPVRVCVLPKRKKQKARPKGVNLKVRWRAKVAMR